MIAKKFQRRRHNPSHQNTIPTTVTASNSSKPIGTENGKLDQHKKLAHNQGSRFGILAEKEIIQEEGP